MKNIITDISIKEDMSLITLSEVENKHGTLFDIFTKTKEFNINVDMISQSFPIKEKVELSFTVKDEDIPKLFKLTAKYKEFKTAVFSGNSQITFFGKDMTNTTGVAAYIFKIFAETATDIKMVTTSDSEVTVLISSTDLENVKKHIDTL